MEQEKYDVFISYSRKDYVDEHKNVIPGNEVSKIKDALTNAGITYWFDEDGIYSGDNFVEKIVSNIENAKVFLFLSTANANKSLYTCKEIASADEFKKHIIPVRIDSTPYNKKVLFRIADLNYIEYYTNPHKGIEDMIRSIKAYLEKLAKADRERKEEEKKKELEKEKAKAKTIKEISEIEILVSKLDNDENGIDIDRKYLILRANKLDDETHRHRLIELIDNSGAIHKKHKVETHALEEKIAALEQIISSIDSNNNDDKSSHNKNFIIDWRHPKLIWQQVVRTFAQRNMVTNILFVFCFIVSIALFPICAVKVTCGFSLDNMRWFIYLSIVSCFYMYGIFYCLVNKRIGIYFLMLFPIMVSPLVFITLSDEWPNNYYVFERCFWLTIIETSISFSLFVLLLLKKNGCTAWKLMESEYPQIGIKGLTTIFFTYSLFIFFSFYVYSKGIDSFNKKISETFANEKDKENTDKLYLKRHDVWKKADLFSEKFKRYYEYIEEQRLDSILDSDYSKGEDGPRNGYWIQILGCLCEKYNNGLYVFDELEQLSNQAKSGQIHLKQIAPGLHYSYNETSISNVVGERNKKMELRKDTLEPRRKCSVTKDTIY